uniref:UCR_hinge domain-containing protein n=1 Tax=Meloidogyne hapla TaxID=6305 RepID=A0A1I8BIA9_MELHA
MSDVSKGLAGWVQSYKEPKTGEEELKVHSENSSTKQKESERSAPIEEEEEEEEEPTCTIKVQKVEKHIGKCVRLRGNVGACQTDKYLDPQNAECMFL